jgi:hypothetical protein
MRTPLALPIKTGARLLHRTAVKRRMVLARPLLQPLSPEADAIRTRGYAIVTDVLDPATLEALAQAAAPRLSTARKGGTNPAAGKGFWSRLLDEDVAAGRLTTDSPFAAFALQPAVLRIVAQVYGELPQLDSVLLTWSRFDDKPLSVSQLWHRDFDDTRVVKLFVYLTNVGSGEDGPFTFIDGPLSDRARYSVKSHRTDAMLAPKIDPARATAIQGPALTAFIVETSRCLHMGSRVAAGHDRLLYTATFISTPRLYPEPNPQIRLTGQESETVQCVLTPA